MGKTAGAIAARFAFPDRVSVAMVGDGAMQMGGMAELLTAAKYYKTSADPQLVVLILNNEDLNGMTKAFVAAPKEGLPGALSAVREFAHEFLPGRQRGAQGRPVIIGAGAGGSVLAQRLARPRRGGRYGFFYESMELHLATNPQTILVLEMNGAPLPIEHGAPVRLRVETQLGFKMVKWIKAIEFVADPADVGMGMGGWREDQQYYANAAGI